jgi:hypothetical protein
MSYGVKSIAIVCLLVIVSQAAAQSVRPCPADLDCSGEVNVTDLLLLFDAWGECPDPNDCPADLSGDGAVNTSDLLLLFDAWGECVFEYAEPHENSEVWQIGLEFLGEDGPLLPSQEILDRIERDMDLIRTEVPHLKDKIHVAKWVPNTIIASYPANEPAPNVECLLAYYQGEVTNVFFGHMHVIQFAGQSNMEAMSALFADLPETAWAEPDHILGGDNFWVPTDLGGGTWHWWIDNGWHDCFDGCDCHIIYDIEVDIDGNVTVLNVQKFGMPWCEFPW